MPGLLHDQVDLMPDPTMLYKERDSAVIVTLNGPDTVYALTVDMVQSVVNVIERATPVRAVGSIVIHSDGRTP